MTDGVCAAGLNACSRLQRGISQLRRRQAPRLEAGRGQILADLVQILRKTVLIGTAANSHTVMVVEVPARGLEILLDGGVILLGGG